MHLACLQFVAACKHSAQETCFVQAGHAIASPGTNRSGAQTNTSGSAANDAIFLAIIVEFRLSILDFDKAALTTKELVGLMLVWPTMHKPPESMDAFKKSVYALSLIHI